MYWTKLFIPTLREGDSLLERAGYTRQHSYLFLGRKSLRRIEAIVREELDLLGAQEIYIKEMEGQSISGLARELRSQKQLPQIWYQLQASLDACSFDATAENLEERYATISQAFQRILKRCGVEVLIAGSISGKKLMVPSPQGEDFIVRDDANYLADLSSAVSNPKPPAAPDSEGDLLPELFHTPARKTIAELAEFTGLPETSHIKSLVMIAGDSPILALLRGDHPLSREKLGRIVRVHDVRPANAEEIGRLFEARAGSLGPVGIAGLRILADEALRGRRNMIAGANKDDHHLRHVTPGEDFECEFFDLRRAAEGETSIHTGEPLRFDRATELAFLARDPIAEPHHTGHYRLAIDRVLSAAADQHRDADGLVLPASLAPFDVIVTPVSFGNEAQRKAAFEITEAAKAAGLDILLDDRDERPGVKFKDADLIGIPWRVTIGKKIDEGLVEAVDRRSKQRTDVPASEVAAFLSTRH
ncbi:MAG TPA: YbaK/EbsC family protein [Bryobacteraceae bacterium]|jgi:prolyl-tRNA synthetase